MRRLGIPLILFLAALAPPLEAQILKVHFKDEKAQRKFKKSTCEIDGETVFVGEPVPGGGILIDRKGGSVTVHYKADRANDFFALDSSDPSKVPYRMESGEPVAVRKSSIVSIPGKYVARIDVLMSGETIETIAREYRLRSGRIDELRAARDSHEKGSVEWFAQHKLMLGGYERLMSWLENLSFTDAAVALRKEYAKEAKAVSDEATRIRAQRALESVEMIGTPDDLAQAVQRAGGGDRYHFKIQQSQHLRLVYQTELISDAQAAELLVFGEKVIEGFRNQFVDPYVSETFAEHVPDGPFQEFYFGPDDVAFHEKMLVEYYGLSWGDPAHRKRALEMSGSSFLRGAAPRLLDYRRLADNRDLEGIFAHILGHALADHHFNGEAAGMQQPWIEEGLGYYLSFEFLGRNSVVCREFRETHYVREDAKEGYKDLQMGYRDVLLQVALEKGERIDRVMLKRLVDMEDPDLAKSWSFLEYLARDGGLDGERWMRAACQSARNRSKFLDELRTISEQMLGVSGEDVFQVMDDRWRAYAEAELAKAY